eukprot:maker-scaffold97_size377342-snap-gene-2.17 protein:Tk12122 transcript:maker-scaffold97_size377342-snap-gene-2.17-mRNA-1 annotation:"hypothetical protein DAPPUDRAFT_122326"
MVACDVENVVVDREKAQGERRAMGKTPRRAAFSSSSSSSSSSSEDVRRSRIRRGQKKHSKCSKKNKSFAERPPQLSPVRSRGRSETKGKELEGRYYNKYIRNKKSPEDNLGSHTPTPLLRPKSSLVMEEADEKPAGLARTCLFCPQPNQVEFQDYYNHLVAEHERSLFKCSLCDESEEIESKFETFQDIRDHVQKTHAVITDEGVKAMIKLPYVMYLRRYKCQLCNDEFVATSESELITNHFKDKHNSNKVNSKMLVRTCRICGLAKWKSDSELIKHLNHTHPRGDFDDDEDDDEANGHEGMIPPHGTNGDVKDVKLRDGELLEIHNNEVLDPVLSTSGLLAMNNNVKESDVKPSEQFHSSKRSLKSESSSSSDSEGSSDRASAPPSQDKPMKKKPRKRMVSEESKTTRLDFEPDDKPTLVIKADIGSVKKLRKTRSKDSLSDGELSEDEKRGGRSSAIATNGRPKRSRSRSYSSRRSREELTSCLECNTAFPWSEAYKHYTGRDHFQRIRKLIRCYLCCKYVQYTKDHLEDCHVGEVFQCKLSACSRPKFLDLVKILNHMDDKHFSETRNKSKEELIRRNMIAIPRNLQSLKCRLCNLPFVGQDVHNVLDHQRREHQETPSSKHILFQCRVCGPKIFYRDEEDLADHCKTHVSPLNRVVFKGRKSRSSSRSSSRSYSSRSRSRSPRRSYVPCSFCPQVYEDCAKDKKGHELTHQRFWFTCRKCSFGSLDRYEVMDHVNDRHDYTPKNDEGYYGEWISLPSDLRKIFCHVCRVEKKKRVEWACRSVDDCKVDFENHVRNEHRGSHVESCIYLGCRACNDHQYLDDPVQDWKEHQKGHVSKAQFKAHRSPSPTRSHTLKPPREGQREVICPYCCQNIGTNITLETHIRRNHMKSTFVCLLCPTSDQRIFVEEGQLKHHVNKDHRTDSRREKWQEWLLRPEDLRAVHCKLCMDTFYALGTKEIQDVHWRVQHASAKFHGGHLEFKCRICDDGEDFEDEDELVEHLEKAHKGHGSQIQEMVCMEVETGRNHLSRAHQLDVISKGQILESFKLPQDWRQINCIPCGLVFLAQDDSLAKHHLDTVHGPPPSHAPGQSRLLYFCRCCGTQFESLPSLELHGHTCTIASAVSIKDSTRALAGDGAPTP